MILAGGLATRMEGEAKGLLTVHGRPIVDRVAEALRASTDQLRLAIGDADSPTALPDVPRVRDVFALAGPLGGIHAALSTTGGDVIACAWDMPYVSARLLLELRSLGEQGYDAVVPCSDDAGRLEPLCAWYSASVLPVIERKLRAGDWSVMDLVGACNSYTVPVERVRQFGDPGALFLNVNSPNDLALARSSPLETIER